VTRLIYTLAICLGSILFLASCTHQASIPTRPLKPGNLTWTLAGMTDVTTLDPAGATDPASLAVCDLIYGGLVRLDAHLQVKPDGAERWTISPDGLRYTFYLRPNLRFSNGKIVTANDVVASLQRALGPAGSNGIVGDYLSDVARVHGMPAIRALNRHAIRIQLRQPSAAFLSKLTFPGTDIVDVAMVNHYGPVWTQHADGFGPYRLVSWIHGRKLVLAPNPYYPVQAHLHRLTIVFASAATAERAFAQGKTDIVSQLTPSSSVLRRFGRLAHISPALALDYVVLNTRRQPLTHKRVRQALALAVDRSALTKAVFGVSAVPVGTLAPPSLLPSPSEGGANPAAARTELQEAGYPLGRGLRPLRYLYPNTPLETLRAHLLQQLWRRTLDIKIVPVGLSPASYSAALMARDFDLALVRWGAEYADAADFLDTQLRAGAANNLSGWSNWHFQHLIDAANAAAPESIARRRYFEAAAAIALGQAVWIPLDSPLQLALIAARVHGVHLTPAGLMGWPEVTLVGYSQTKQRFTAPAHSGGHWQPPGTTDSSAPQQRPR
jgi:oligopeptide transport system substrate-binding protein